MMDSEYVREADPAFEDETRYKRLAEQYLKSAEHWHNQYVEACSRATELRTHYGTEVYDLEYDLKEKSAKIAELKTVLGWCAMQYKLSAYPEIAHALSDDVELEEND